VEADVKNRLGVTIRCIPLEGGVQPGTCVITGRPSAGRVVWGKSY
jgi:prolyl-tRNA synthetase